MYPSEPFPHFVDDYLAYLHEVLPTQASLDGVHLHDDLLEDLSRPAHRRARPRRWPGSAVASTRSIRVAPASSRAGRAPHRRREHRGADVRARGDPDLGAQPADLRRRSSARAWPARRCSAYAPEPERARRVVSKLRQVPRLVQAARDNIKETPGIFVKVGLEAWRGALKFIESDLPRAFSTPRRSAHPGRPGRHVHRSGGRHLVATSTTSKPISRRAPRRRSGWVGSASSRS